MCGIVAIFSPEGRVEAASLAAATARLRHRGPDGQQHWLASHQQAGLGHARLSVMDPRNGTQPMANENGSIHITVNGEFYGFESIRRDLEKRGHVFRTCSDSEIAVHLYEERGLHALSQLRGEFAFALWDEDNRTLIAARDRFGIKPLFYAMHAGNLFLASEAKALFAAGVPARWDDEALYQQLFLCQSLDRTLFEDVRQLPPGHHLIANRGGVRITRYWDLDYPRHGDAGAARSEAEWTELTRNALTDAVNVRMRADVPVGALLSGGLDSSAVLGIASQQSGPALEAYTVAFNDRDYDETAVATETAAFTGSTLHVLDVSGNDIADHMADAIEHAETLAINGHGVARYLLCREIHRAGHKVVLTGDGADEIFAGYIQSRGDAIEARQRSAAGETQWTDFAARVLGFVPSWMTKLTTDRQVFHLLLESDFAERHQHRNPVQAFLSQFDIDGQIEGRDPLTGALYLWTRSILPNYSLFAERLEMAWGLEARIPFLDHQLFQLVREVPPSLLIRGGLSKYILRKAAEPYLTPRVFERAKHPFLAPPVAGAMQALLNDTLRGTVARSVPFLDHAALVELLDRLPRMHESRRSAVEVALQLALSACLLHQRYQL